jgi:hypothetical protein
MCANPLFDKEGFNETAKTAYLQADAMLAARGEQEPEPAHEYNGQHYHNLLARNVAEIADLKAELTKLQRRLEPLTMDEACKFFSDFCLNCPDDAVSIVDAADHIREGRS